VTYTRVQREQFLAAYVEAALWSSVGEDGEPLDSLPQVQEAYQTMDVIEADTAAQMHKDCRAFMDDNMNDLLAAEQARTGYDAAQGGHDFWLTRNGHGAGFWDRGLGEVGERLTKAAKAYGGIDLMVDDDGKIYGN
jgi:hypothetical protein